MTQLSFLLGLPQLGIDQIEIRYHLLRNVAEVGERILAHHRKSLK